MWHTNKCLHKILNYKKNLIKNDRAVSQKTTERLCALTQKKRALAVTGGEDNINNQVVVFWRVSAGFTAV